MRVAANEHLLDGELDDNIKSRYTEQEASHQRIFKTKYKEKVKITKADLHQAKRTASRRNKELEGATWVPKEGDSRKNIVIPEFQVTTESGSKVIGIYNDIKVACIALVGLSYGNVRLCLRKKRQTVDGFCFDFSNPDSQVVIDWLASADLEAGD